MSLPTHSLIPKGPYCYDENGRCPFWSIDQNRPHQYNGYCAFLGKGDWNLNMDEVYTVINNVTGEVTEIIKKDAPIPLNLLWDACKECDINEDWEED